MGSNNPVSFSFPTIQFSDGTKQLDNKMAFAFQRKVEHEIDGKFAAFEQANELKRIEFIVSIFSSVFS